MGEAVAFDLDMTLVDSRPASRRALEQLASENDLDIDIEALMDVYGLPLDRWLPADVNVGTFRRLQLQRVADVVAMPGAAAALAAVCASGRRVLVVTGAARAVAAAMLAAVGLEADRVRGDVWAGGKVVPLREERCLAYVGDHADDMAAARAAGVLAIGVDTGTSPPTGADVVLADLRGFPWWLDGQPAP